MVARSSLSAMTVERLWALYSPQHNVTREFFESRLDGFERVALFRARTDRHVVGFTGVRMRDVVSGSRRCRTVYFGQTYIADGYRGQQTIPRTVTRLLLTERVMAPRMPWFFWCDALTYKPYLVMARNLDRFYPHPTMATPPDVQELLDRLGEVYYPGSYDPKTGVVAKDQARLKEHVAPIGERESRDPFIRFYARRNPGHASGNGLLITCPMTLENLASYLRRRAGGMIARAA
jgi:hypothetical protein